MIVSSGVWGESSSGVRGGAPRKFFDLFLVKSCTRCLARSKICSTHSSLLRHHNAQLSCTLLRQTDCIESSAREAAVAARCWHDDTHSSVNAHMNLSCTRSAAAGKLQIGVAFLLLGRHICRLAVLASADRQRSCQLLSLPAMLGERGGGARSRSEERESEGVMVKC